MTATSGLRARPDGQGRTPAETALSWAAVAAGAGAVFAWAACCVLPMSLALAGLGLARLVRAATLALQSAEWLPPGQVAEFHPYTLYATIVFVLATTYGLVLMANESAVRRDAELFADR